MTIIIINYLKLVVSGWISLLIFYNNIIPTFYRCYWQIRHSNDDEEDYF